MATSDAKWPSRIAERKVHYFRAPRSAEGMGCTMSDVVRQLPHGCDFLVALADMPFIRQETIGRLVARFSLSNKSAPIVFPLWVASGASESAVNGPEYGAGRRGHPVIFHRSYREELGGLAGERGAGCVVAAHPAAHEPVEVNDAGVIADVDRPADLRHT
jgi:molybdenum cofactor cytidylyltransferase